MTTRVTSAEVAKLAGVSQSAVSRVFTPGASASAATVAKVKKAAEALGYRPNRMARAMITGKSRIIGLIVTYLDNQFYPVAIERLSNVLQAQGYHLLVFTLRNDEGVDRIVQELMGYQVDGIITASVGMSNDLTKRCADAGIPVVMFNRGQDGVDLSSVTSANRTGAASVADAFLAMGRKRLAHISGWQGSSTGRDRQVGFVSRLAEHGLAPVALIDGHYDRDIAAQATRDMMAGPDAPDAIFVGNDHMAFAVMDTLRFELGLRVPQDVAVIGYDDVPAASWLAYDLTTVRQPVRQMVDATVDLILAQIETSDTPARRIEINGPLIFRGSAPLQEGQTA